MEQALFYNTGAKSMGDLLKGKFKKPKDFIAVYNADYWEYEIYYGNDIICHVHESNFQLFLDNFKSPIEVVIPAT